MSRTLTRADLLGRSARGGVALVVSGGALGVLAETAAAAPLPTTDLAYVRLLVGAELLAADFYGLAVSAANSSGPVLKALKRAAFNEQEHYNAVAGILSGAGVTPAVAGDIDFSYPTGTFATQEAVVAFGSALEATILGAYLGAIAGIQTASIQGVLAEVAACEAQHLSYLTVLGGGKAFNLSFPPALTIQQASDAFDAYAA